MCENFVCFPPGKKDFFGRKFLPKYMKISKFKSIKNTVFWEIFKELAKHSKFQLKNVLSKNVFKGVFRLYIAPPKHFLSSSEISGQKYAILKNEKAKKNNFLKWEKTFFFRIFVFFEGWYIGAENSASQKNISNYKNT